MLKAILGFLPQACFSYLQKIVEVSFMHQIKLHTSQTHTTVKLRHRFALVSGKRFSSNMHK